MDNNNILLQNKYKIIKKIGSGTYSNIYKAIHIYKNTYVAIKFDYDEISKKLIENEISNYLYLYKNKSNNIVNIKSFGVINKYNYIIMDLLEYNLQEYFNNNELKTENINYCFNYVIDLVKQLHKNDILHRDIKPENFILDKNNKIYIIDLGLSCNKQNIKKSSSIIGSIFFSSFNVHREDYIYTKKDDFISICYMFMYLVTKKIPWENITIDDKKLKNTIVYNLKRHINFEKYYNYDKRLKHILSTYNDIMYDYE